MNTYGQIRRVWINQPSTLQDLHEYHGEFAIAEPIEPGQKTVRIHFTSGQTHSMIAFVNSLELCKLSSAKD
jgi:hypothetical protein